MENLRGAPARSFQDLIIWRKAHPLALDVYKLTARFPKQELYGQRAQFRRAAVSIPATIAEGFRKRGRVDKSRYMNIGQGSLEECRDYLRLAQDLGYCDSRGLLHPLDEVGRLLDAYLRSILARSSQVPSPGS